LLASPGGQTCVLMQRHAHHRAPRSFIAVRRAFRCALHQTGPMQVNLGYGAEHANLWGLFRVMYGLGSPDEGELVPKMVCRMKLVAELELRSTIEAEVARLERDEQADRARRKGANGVGVGHWRGVDSPPRGSSGRNEGAIKTRSPGAGGFSTTGFSPIGADSPCRIHPEKPVRRAAKRKTLWVIACYLNNVIQTGQNTPELTAFQPRHLVAARCVKWSWPAADRRAICGPSPK